MRIVFEVTVDVPGAGATDLVRVRTALRDLRIPGAVVEKVEAQKEDRDGG
ncbi:MAG: hypothetical protein JRN42_07735 [Nitrososphaerota archaeon]|nr:hypothetical protein [Nitrososphaerota archaeon]